MTEHAMMCCPFCVEQTSQARRLLAHACAQATALSGQKSTAKHSSAMNQLAHKTLLDKHTPMLLTYAAITCRLFATGQRLATEC